MSVFPQKLDDAYALRAAWAIPVDGEPISDAQLIVENGRIKQLSSAPARPADGVQTIDLGDVALLPGFVNAHAHLEFSDLDEPLGKPGATLPEWIGRVFAYRESAEQPAARQRIEMGVAQSASGGATCVADIVTTENLPADAPIDWMPLRELIGLKDESIAACLQRAEEFLVCFPNGGLSPHAPYTVRRDLLAELVKLSQRRRVPLIMHLGETLEELQLLGSGTGPFAELLKSRDLWSPELFPGGLSCLDYLRALSLANRAIAVHGNYFEEADLAFLAEHRATMSLVFCPRTHAFFQHPRHKIVEAHLLGVRCAIGTDGRGSNPNLSMLEEVRALAVAYGRLTPDAILRMGTLNGAEALGRADETGSLVEGKSADMAVVEIDPSRWNEPRQAVLYGTGKVVATIRAGQIASCM